MWNLKQSELEELSFMYAYPEEHAEIKQWVEALRKKQEDVVSEVSEGFTLYFTNWLLGLGYGTSLI